MYSCNDDNDGVVQTNWKAARAYFKKVAPEFTRLVDILSPDDSFKIYLFYFPYGMLKGETSGPYVPLKNNIFCKLSDNGVAPVIQKDLGYGMFTSPLGMVLNKRLEYFLEFDDEVIPYQILGPGEIFNKSILLMKNQGRIYSPNGLLKASSGSRTAFMLPSISNHNGIMKLRRATNSLINTPRKLGDHFQIFKAISKNKNEWKLCLAYFSKKWIDSLTKDHSWIELKSFILEEEKTSSQYSLNSSYYDIFFSQIQKNSNARTTNQYLTNTAIHLIKIALGEHPGYIPTTTEDLFPLELIQNYMLEYFQMKKIPTVMTPHSFNYESDSSPVYYSMQHPTTPHFLIKKNERVSANQEIEVMSDILNKFLMGMADHSSILRGTVFADLPRNVTFDYYHNYPPKRSELIQNTNLLSNIDSRFQYLSNPKATAELPISHEGQFVRGCVQISPSS
jgi:hypothetical protein